ncbi:MAG: D-aminoacyl-tRNA deacylase [Phycisphaerales bacterium]|nr:D-aminoacyl-tRNA deacylase [Phycisphaerales bacterium]
MIAVVQRVSSASVTIETPPHQHSIGGGLLVLLGVERGDTSAGADWMAAKLARLRIFPDADGRMNRSTLDVEGSILLISQFTLVGDASQGHRPSFMNAAEPHVAEELYDRVAQRLCTNEKIPVGTGIFGAQMQVELVNDGPVTILVNTPASLSTRA